MQYTMCVKRIVLSVCKVKHSHTHYLSFEPSLDPLFSGQSLFVGGTKMITHYLITG
jgi:hypothetical protein